MFPIIVNPNYSVLMQAKRLEKESDILQERFVMLIGQVRAVIYTYIHTYINGL
jgi:hypothetical protein